MVGPQLGRETAESAYKIKRRLCVTALHGYYNQVGWKSGPAKAGPAGSATPPLLPAGSRYAPLIILLIVHATVQGYLASFPGLREGGEKGLVSTVCTCA